MFLVWVRISEITHLLSSLESSNEFTDGQGTKEPTNPVKMRSRGKMCLFWAKNSPTCSKLRLFTQLPVRGTPRHTCRIASCSVQPNDPRDNLELSTVKSHNLSTQTSETPSPDLPAPNQSPRLLDFTSEITGNHHPIFSICSGSYLLPGLLL